MRIVAVVPAYNEEKTVGRVVETVRRVPLVDEVIVVSDGSEDGTARVARQAGAVVIDLDDNVGKGGAMKAGVKGAAADIILFLDADLIGLTESHVTDLLTPVLGDEADMTLGVFKSGRAATDLAQALAPHLSGQRAVRADVLSRVPEIEVARFGVELALTRFASENRIRVKEVPLPGMTHIMKEEKMGFSRGFFARMRMYWDIVRAFMSERG
ncbi:MAG: glycosyltransferase family 2 protein [Ignavibacteriales bacterium]